MPLCQVLFAIVASRHGLHALLLLGVAGFAGGVAIAWLRGARSIAGLLATLPLALFAIWLQRDDFCARGQVFGDLALAALLVILFALRDGRRPRLWLVAASSVAFGAVWMNLHASALAAPVVVVVFAASFFALPRDRRPPLRPFIVVACGLAIGLFINPYGARLVVDVARLAASPSTAAIDLFRSPSFRAPDVLVTIAVALGALVLAVRASAYEEGALVVVWLAAACAARRHLEPLSIVCVFVVGRRVDALLATRATRATRAPRATRALGRVASLATGAVAVVGGVLLALDLRSPKDPLAQVPSDAAAFVVDHGLRENVMNPYHWGGYLDYAWSGRPRVFIDGRNNLFDNGVFDDHASIASLEPSWLALLDVYEIQTVLWERGAPLDRALHDQPGWREAFRGRLAVVYVRQGPSSPAASPQ
jgi:hypothetical protein